MFNMILWCAVSLSLSIYIYIDTISIWYIVGIHGIPYTIDGTINIDGSYCCRVSIWYIVPWEYMIVISCYFYPVVNGGSDERSVWGKHIPKRFPHVWPKLVHTILPIVYPRFWTQSAFLFYSHARRSLIHDNPSWSWKQMCSSALDARLMAESEPWIV